MGEQRRRPSKVVARRQVGVDGHGRRSSRLSGRELVLRMSIVDHFYSLALSHSFSSSCSRSLSVSVRLRLRLPYFIIFLCASVRLWAFVSTCVCVMAHAGKTDDLNRDAEM